MKSKKNIWYISKYIAPSYAAKNQARGFLILKALASMGHSTTLITSDSSHQTNAPVFPRQVYRELVEGVEVFWLKTLKYRGANSIGRVLSWFDFEFQLFKMPKKDLPKPDCIIVSSLSLLTIINGLLLRRRYGCLLVFEIRDIWPLVLIETGKYRSYNPFVLALKLVEKIGYNSADLVVGTMPNLVEHVNKVTGKSPKVVCIPQGVDPELLLGAKPLSKQFVDDYVPQDRFVVCHAGSIGSDNALDTLISCARKMKERKDVCFLFVGEGDLKERYIEENSDLPNLIFAPRVERDQVQTLLQHVDLVYFSVGVSSLWNYGQSLNKIIDYMLSAKPIVASYTGYPSMINESGCGVFVPAGDVDSLENEITRLKNISAEERAEMGARGRDWVMKNRQFDKLAEDYLKYIFD